MWQIRVRRMSEVRGYEQRATTKFFRSAARNERTNKMLGSVGVRFTYASTTTFDDAHRRASRAAMLC